MALPLAALAAGMLLIAGCGSSKPEYCTKSSELKSALKALTEVNLSKEGVAGAEAAIRRVQSTAKETVSSAKSEFPQQTEAISDAAEELADSVREASKAQTSSAAISKIPAEIVALGSAANGFSEATKSKCE